MTAMQPPIDETFTVTEAEVRAGRALPDTEAVAREMRDRELTFLVGLVGLGIGFGLAWLPLGFIVPFALVTAVALWSRGGRT